MLLHLCYVCAKFFIHIIIISNHTYHLFTIILIIAWKNIVSIAAFDCSTDENYPICREHEIEKTPTLKFFTVNAKLNDQGIKWKIKLTNEDSIIQALTTQLVKEQEEGRGSTWPNIVPYRYADILFILDITIFIKLKLFFLLKT